MKRPKGLVIFWVVAIAISLSLSAGFRREAEMRKRHEADRTIGRGIRLRYGVPSPEFTLLKVGGGTLSKSDLLGKWSVLIFSQTDCPACDAALDQLQSLRPALRNWNVVVLLAQRRFKPLSITEANQYSDAQTIDATVVIGDKQVYTQYCDSPLVTPFTVILDPKGNVRYAEGGFSPDRQFGLSGILLSGDKKNRVQEKQAIKDLKLSTRAGSVKIISDRDIAIDGGKPERLSKLWRSGTLILTFFKDFKTEAERERLSVLSKFAKVKGPTRFVCISKKSWTGTATALGPALQKASDPTGKLFRDFDIMGTPITVVIRNGRVVLGEDPFLGSSEFLRDRIATYVAQDSLNSWEKEVK